MDNDTIAQITAINIIKQHDYEDKGILDNEKVFVHKESLHIISFPNNFARIDIELFQLLLNDVGLSNMEVDYIMGHL